MQRARWGHRWQLPMAGGACRAFSTVELGWGWSMAKWGFISVRTLSELNIDLADSDSPSTYSMSTDWVPGARSLAHVILSNENRKKTQVRKPRPKEVGDLLRFPWFRLPAQTPSATPQLVTFAGWQTQLLATQLALDKLCREQAAG